MPAKDEKNVVPVSTSEATNPPKAKDEKDEKLIVPSGGLEPVEKPAGVDDDEKDEKKVRPRDVVFLGVRRAEPVYPGGEVMAEISGMAGAEYRRVLVPMARYEAADKDHKLQIARKALAEG